MSPYAEQLPTPTPGAPPMLGIAEPPAAEFSLDREEAISAIARAWDIDPEHRELWWIGGFGSDMAESIELLTNVVFSKERGLVGGPRLDILILPVVPNSTAHPVMVGVRDGVGPIVCRGIEDLHESLPEPFGHGPEQVLDSLETLLAVATSLLPDVERLAGEPWSRPLGLSAERTRRRRP